MVGGRRGEDLVRHQTKGGVAENVVHHIRATLPGRFGFLNRGKSHRLKLLPQRVVEEGGYRIKGKSDTEAERLAADAQALAVAGVQALVLELVHAPLAAQITRAVPCPTIGIGSGKDCDGNILVFHDLVGLFPWFRPKFATPRADLAGEIERAVGEFAREVRGD